MKLFFLAFCILLSQSLFAQQYLIKYDMTDKQTNYFKVVQNDTTKIKSIDLRKSGRIFLQVNNYNPFYWNAKVTAYKTPVDEEVGYADAFNPFNFLAGGMGGIMGGLPKLEMPKSRGELSRSELDEATYNFLSTATKYAETYEDIQQLNAKLEELQIAKLQLTDMKFDITKNEATIKSEAQKTITKVLNINTNTIELSKVLEIGRNYNNRLTNSLEDADTLLRNLHDQQKLVNKNMLYEGKTLKEIGESANSSYYKLARLKTAQMNNPNLLMDEVFAVANLYKEISNANFQFSYAIKNEDDISDIKVEFYPKPEMDSKDTIVHYFELKRKKAIRIKNSVGVAFSYFNANNTSYYIGADSVIRSGQKDLFTPLLATFIHFYSGNTTGIKWGGAFGFGIPLQGENKDLNFMLGLSAGIGKNEPILITVGASGAQVNKLSNGYKPGDVTTITDPAQLITSGYGIGGFLGITFNLSYLGSGKNN